MRVLQNPVLTGNVKIQYTLPKATHIKLAVYNTLGQVEEILIDDIVSAGVYGIKIKKNLGIKIKKNLPQGVYFVKLTTDKQSIIEKVIFIK